MLCSMLVLFGAEATTLTFTHMDSTWTIDAHDGYLEVTADCPESKWCGFGFNENKPTMEGAEALQMTLL